MRMIPAIDIIGGKCVRLSKGDYGTAKVYNEDPLEVAKMFETHGVQYLHLVDLDGAKAGRIINYRILETIASGTGLQVDFGGGLRTNEDLRVAFECGAAQVTGGSISVKDEETFSGWLEQHGPERIILGADVRHEKIAVSGWQEESSEDLWPFLDKYLQKGIRYVICTDISKDGMLQGPATDLYRKILDHSGQNGIENVLKLVASGGVSDMDDLIKLRELGCDGAIIGKALYENKIGLKQLEKLILDS